MATLRSFTISLNYFRKNYCPYCGGILTKKAKVTILHKGDKGFRRTHRGTGFNPFVDTNEITTYDYLCENCFEIFSDDEVDIIRKLQRKEKRKIVTGYKESRKAKMKMVFAQKREAKNCQK